MSAETTFSADELLRQFHVSPLLLVDIGNQDSQLRVSVGVGIDERIEPSHKFFVRLPVSGKRKLKSIVVRPPIGFRFEVHGISLSKDHFSTVARAIPRCTCCGRLQGKPHAEGCRFAIYTIRRNP